MKARQDRRLAQALKKASDESAAPRIRLRACDTLLQFGHVSAALPSLRKLVPHPEYGGRARLLQRTGEYLLRRGLVNDADPAGADLRGKGRTVISEDTHSGFWRSLDPKVAAESLVIVFTGVSRQFWISLDILHRILGRYFGQIVYLRDHRSIFYLAGVGDWGGYDATLKRLRDIAAQAKAAKLFVMGISAGGYAALKYGLDLSADAVLALSPRTELGHLREKEKSASRLRRLRIPAEALDLLPAYDRAPRRPQSTIVFGAKNERDALQAQRLAHLPEVRLMPLAGVAAHNVMVHLLTAGEFDRYLQRLRTP